MPARRTNAEKILARLKGLASYLQPNEEPIAAFPAIWDNASGSTLCDVVITQQRVIGFYFRSFPRERLFLDSLSLSQIKSVTFRQKSHEPLFRELFITEDNRQVYVRAPRKKIADLHAALQAAIDQYGVSKAPHGQEDTDVGQDLGDERLELINGEQKVVDEGQEAVGNIQASQQTLYGRQELQKPFETSTLVILLLFVGGIVLEIVGVRLWSVTGDAQIGFPLCFAGFVAVGASIWLRRKQE